MFFMSNMCFYFLGSRKIFKSHPYRSFSLFESKLVIAARAALRTDRAPYHYGLIRSYPQHCGAAMWPSRCPVIPRSQNTMKRLPCLHVALFLARRYFLMAFNGPTLPCVLHILLLFFLVAIQSPPLYLPMYFVNYVTICNHTRPWISLKPLCSSLKDKTHG